MLSILRTTATFLILTGSVYAATPFGIGMGQPLSDLDVREEGPKPQLNSVPNPHPDFQLYSVWASDDTGVCVLIAISKFYENDRYGVNIRSDFGGFVNALEEKYGPSQLIDRRLPGGIWKDADEWVMAIRQNERVYAATWDSFQPESEGTDLQYLELSVFAVSSNSTVMKLTYKFTNFDQCKASIESEENSGF